MSKKLRMVHLTNYCMQVQSDKCGMHEEGNCVSFSAIDAAAAADASRPLHFRSEVSLYPVPCTLYPIPCTLHFRSEVSEICKTCTLHPVPCVQPLHFRSEVSLYPVPCTLCAAPSLQERGERDL